MKVNYIKHKQSLMLTEESPEDEILLEELASSLKADGVEILDTEDRHGRSVLGVPIDTGDAPWQK